MKKLCSILATLVITFAVVLPPAALITGCSTTQQTVTYNTLYSVEHTTVAAYDGYVKAVITGQASTNGLPAVSKSFNAFQASFLVALDAAQFNTNALAPANLMVESADVINLISQFKSKAK